MTRPTPMQQSPIMINLPARRAHIRLVSFTVIRYILGTVRLEPGTPAKVDCFNFYQVFC